MAEPFLRARPSNRQTTGEYRPAPEDAPAEDTIDDEAEQAQHQQRHEDVATPDVEARRPRAFLPRPLLAATSLGGHDGDEGSWSSPAHPGQI